MISPQSDFAFDNKSRKLQRMEQPDSKRWIWKVPSFEKDIPKEAREQPQGLAFADEPVTGFSLLDNRESSGTMMIGGLIFAVFLGALTTILALVFGKSVLSAILLGLVVEVIAYLAPIIYCFVKQEVKGNG